MGCESIGNADRGSDRREKMGADSVAARAGGRHRLGALRASADRDLRRPLEKRTVSGNRYRRLPERGESNRQRRYGHAPAADARSSAVPDPGGHGPPVLFRVAGFASDRGSLAGAGFEIRGRTRLAGPVIRFRQRTAAVRAERRIPSDRGVIRVSDGRGRGGLMAAAEIPNPIAAERAGICPFYSHPSAKPVISDSPGYADDPLLRLEAGAEVCGPSSRSFYSSGGRPDGE